MKRLQPLNKIAIVTVLLTAVLVGVNIHIKTKYSTKTVENETESTKEETDQHLYEVSELNDKLIGKDVWVVGFLCNEVDSKYSAAWLCEKPLTSKEEVSKELRIDTGEVIEYTMYPLIIHGTIMADDAVDGDALSFKLGNAKISIYGGPLEKYKRVFRIVDSKVVERTVEIIDKLQIGIRPTDEFIDETIEISNKLTLNELSTALTRTKEEAVNNADELLEVLTESIKGIERSSENEN